MKSLRSYIRDYTPHFCNFNLVNEGYFAIIPLMFKPVEARPNFPEKEQELLKRWYETGIVSKYLHKNDTANQYFSFLDGPITANNPMGVHHAWGRTYKDVWQRFYNLLGYRQRFQNGFDCQGLWVEVEVEKEIGIRNKKDIENLVPGDRIASIAQFVKLCKERVIKFAGIQTEQTKRLGNFMDWEHSYFTMADENNYMIWHFLKVCHEHGWIYKGRDAVPWCPRCETAISQHEMLTEDYKELTHESIYLKLPITSKGWENTALLIWTTTPWTVPANVAVGVHTDYVYGVWENESGERIMILDQDDEEKIPERTIKERVLPINEYILHDAKEDWNKINVIKGSDLLGLRYNGPFDNIPRVQDAQEERPETFHTVVDASELINAHEGTGLLHIAPGAGTEDFRIGKKLGLAVISVIADDASYLDGLGEFSGKNAKTHPELIIDALKDQGALLTTEMYTHRYPACWRCRKELVWKVADEWYIAMDIPSNIDTLTLRTKMIRNAQNIKWLPSFGLDRELDWLEHMEDWLISKKNRYWGLALPIYECAQCGYINVLGGKEELKDRSIEWWKEFEGKSPHKPYIDLVKISCEKCSKPVSRIDDVGNPWLDAGIVPYSTITEKNHGEPLYSKNREEWQNWFPADFITESFPGQFKNWFYALIAMSSALEDQKPFKTVLGFGTLFAEDGRAMHKSWGNAIEFGEGAEKIGVDVMRWMFCRANPAENMVFGYTAANEVRRSFILVLWNIYKFFVEYAQADNYTRTDASPGTKHPLDRWILTHLRQTILTVEEAMNAYDARSATNALESFIADLSTWYIRRSRNRIWTNSKDDGDKNDFYATLHYVLVHISIVLSPFMPFMSDEIFVNLTGQESVHLTSWPYVVKEETDESILSTMAYVRKLIEIGHRERKLLKIKVRQPLQSVTFTLPVKPEFSPDIQSLIKDELNIHDVYFRVEEVSGPTAQYDTHITDTLQKEGEIRELIRNVQQMRQEQGLVSTDYIVLTIPEIPSGYEDYIKQRVMAKSINIGEEYAIAKTS